MEDHIIGHAVLALVVPVVSPLGDPVGQRETVPFLPVLKGLYPLRFLCRLVGADVDEGLLLEVALVLLAHQSFGRRLDAEPLVGSYEFRVGGQLVPLLALS